MQVLLSLPPNVVEQFHAVSGCSPSTCFCTSDPAGQKLGSGGGTTWLLDAFARHCAETGIVPPERRILLHAGGQSRRLPAYAAAGKVRLPIPVFRWARGQRIDQTLLDLQLPLYERIMAAAPERLTTLVASGDVYVRCTEPIAPVPEADVVCYGLWADPAVACNHGVFFINRRQPEALDFVLQKPTVEQLTTLTATHLSLMDIGIWLLSERALRLLRERSFTAGGQRTAYDLYGQFGAALGAHPTLSDAEVGALSVAVVPLPSGEFYHFGTTPEMISSTLALQNLVRDQRLILQKTVKRHPSIFTQNARIDLTFTAEHENIWVENTHLARGWQLSRDHVVTGVPLNDWQLTLRPEQCVDVVPVGTAGFALRPYGYRDAFRGPVSDPTTLFLGQPMPEWMAAHHLRPEELGADTDLQAASLFPLTTDPAEAGQLLAWMLDPAPTTDRSALWRSRERLSADGIADRANLLRSEEQRRTFRDGNLTKMAGNHRKSVFYQLDLTDAADKFAERGLPLPQVPDASDELLSRIRAAMFCARVERLRGDAESEARGHIAEREAFALLREGLIKTALARPQRPRLDIFPDQIVWGRSAVRIDVAGGWTDTPPYCLNSGGNVVNLSVELNGQQPLQVYVKPTSALRIVCRSIDLGAMEVIETYEELAQFNKVGSPFSIPKAALALCGFLPDFAIDRHATLHDALAAFGSGIEVTLLAAIPAGSGLGTSSILAATVLGALSDFCGLSWDKTTIGNRTLVLEQLLTTGGGWQDQYGGMLHGVKLLQTTSGFDQTPVARWLPDNLFTDPEHHSCHLLYYTGLTRTAKNILAEIVRSMFLNSGTHLRLLDEMRRHALDMFDAIQRGDLERYGRLVRKTWTQNKALDPGTEPPAIAALCARIDDLCSGYKLPGAGGGGYLYMVAKDPEAAARIKAILHADPAGASARFVDMRLSRKGLRVSRS